MGRGAWWAAVYGGHKESDMTERLTLSFKALHFERRSGLFSALPRHLTAESPRPTVFHAEG